MGDKIKTYEGIESVSHELRKQGKIIVTTNGSFDILHLAHLNLFEKARSEGDILIVLLNDDESIRKLKGPSRPVVPEKERAQMLSALQSVDYVCIFSGDNPLHLIERIKPHKHVKGGSWEEERIKAERELLGRWGGEFKSFELEKGYSTTNIIDKILKNNK